MRHFLRHWLLATVAVAGLLNTPGATFGQRNVLFSEDFEELTLGDSVDEGFFEEQVWTNEPPAGWSIENDLPGIDEDGIGVTEWKGWSFADKDWWVQTAGDQRRSEFSLGEGIVAIADPDEWDDIGSPKDLGLYNTWLKTAPISVVGVKASSLELDFVSSWRPEAFDDVDNLNNQTARITVSYDGGPEQEIMYWDSDAASDTYHDHLPDEEVNVTIDNPAGAKSMVINFALLTSYNDWWWAIDNIQLTGIGGGAAPGDFNGDGQLDAVDIDQLAAAIRTGGDVATYDLNGDGKINDADHNVWVTTLRKTWYGDSNLDGKFDTTDFVSVFQRGEFEDATNGNSTWEDGDWNGDADFTSSDFVIAFQGGGFEQGPRAAVSAVPEPSSLVLLLMGLCLVARRRR